MGSPLHNMFDNWTRVTSYLNRGCILLLLLTLIFLKLLKLSATWVFIRISYHVENLYFSPIWLYILRSLKQLLLERLLAWVVGKMWTRNQRLKTRTKPRRLLIWLEPQHQPRSLTKSRVCTIFRAVLISLFLYLSLILVVLYSQGSRLLTWVCVYNASNIQNRRVLQ